MRLEFAGAPEIAATPERAWDCLMDHELVASCAPGVETVEPLDETHFRVVSAIGVGAIKARFKLNVELTDLVPPTSLEIAVRGTAPGSAVDALTTLRIEALAAGRSRLSWTATANVRGTLASVGSRLMKGTARKLTEQFWQDFAELVGSRG